LHPWVGAEVDQLQTPYVHATSERRRYPAGPAVWPPNWPRSADTTLVAGESGRVEANRANSAAAITSTGTASRTASSTAHRPSPVSATPPPKDARSGSADSARSSRSSSHERTTVPDRQDFSTPFGSVTTGERRSSSYPSA